MIVHELKIAPEYFNAIKEGLKKFEIRINDRGYQVGDLLVLNEFKEGELTDSKIVQNVTYISDYAQKDNYVVLSIEYVPNSFITYSTLSSKEKEIFHLILSDNYLYGTNNRSSANLFYDTTVILLGDYADSLCDYDKKWYLDFIEKNK